MSKRWRCNVYLTDDKSGGVYAVRDDDKMERVVQMFVDKDDAERYYIMLKADEYLVI